MKIDFTKMHGAGNDFVVIENLDRSLDLTLEAIRYLCDRRFGIGADGLLLLEPADREDVDATMVYFNADGSRAEMCGNGARCFTAFALGHGLGGKNRIRFTTDAGTVRAEAADGLYRIELTPPTSLSLERTIELREGPVTLHSVNTGVPHAVRFVADVGNIDIRSFGSEVRHHPDFSPKGTNVNVAQVQPDGLVRIRTYERGVEDETLACGTGVTAVGILAHLVHGIPLPVDVRVAGGSVLRVDFEKSGSETSRVTLTGPAVSVFAGTIEVPSA